MKQPVIRMGHKYVKRTFEPDNSGVIKIIREVSVC